MMQLRLAGFVKTISPKSMIEHFKSIKALADRELKSEKEMGMVELVVMLYNEHDMAADMIARLVRHANYPFKLTVLNNTNQISPINFSRVWNKCIKETACDFICFMDSDVFVQEDWLNRLMESFLDEEVMLALPVMNKTSSNQQRADREAPYPNAEPLKEILAAQMVVYRKSVFDKVGLFDERFLLYGQDSEWGYRFLKSKLKGVVRRDVWLDHLGSYSINIMHKEENLEYNPSIEREYARNLYKYLTTKK